MGRRLPVEERRNELLRFGQQLFAEHPADAFSMDEIARRAGVSKALLYHYFGGRRGFYVATVEAIAERVRTAITPEPGLGFASSFPRALDRFLSFVSENHAAYRALIRGGIGVDEEVAAIVEDIRQTAMRFVLSELGVPNPSPQVTIATYGWVCFAENAALAWLEQEDPPSRTAILEVLVDAAVPVQRALERER
ncbi:MAG: TetR/AcrR family transcriptional regulator [Myxococcota bacterium]